MQSLQCNVAVQQILSPCADGVPEPPEGSVGRDIRRAQQSAALQGFVSPESTLLFLELLQYKYTHQAKIHPLSSLCLSYMDTPLSFRQSHVQSNYLQAQDFMILKTVILISWYGKYGVVKPYFMKPNESLRPTWRSIAVIRHQFNLTPRTRLTPRATPTVTKVERLAVMMK